jgi:thioredoxin 1
MTIELTDANFQAEVLDSPLPVLVDFWGDYCGPCKRIAPLLDQLAEELAGKARIGKVDVGAHMPLANRYGVRALPNLLFFKDGRVREQFIGSEITKDQLQAKLEALMA